MDNQLYLYLKVSNMVIKKVYSIIKIIVLHGAVRVKPLDKNTFELL